MSKRTVATIKQFDYTSKEEYEKDKDRMRQKGYLACEGLGWGEHLKPGELDDGKWKYTAFFVKSTL